MKLLSEIAKNSLPPKSDGDIVEFIAVIGGMRKLDNPTISTSLECIACSGKMHYAVYLSPPEDRRKLWICANVSCVTTDMKNIRRDTNPPPQALRALLWPKFCEINGIGDENYDVRFENVQQSQGKIDYMLKFSSKPRGIILMQGDPGTGKTYAAMAICELYTRKETSAIFTTQKQMSNNWLETFKPDRYSTYVERVSNANLLVVDDFGTGDIPPGFLGFFMELINTRMQWTNRGTIITTNLYIDKFNKFCGEALADRIMTGQQFEFKGKTRRKKNIL